MAKPRTKSKPGQKPVDRSGQKAAAEAADRGRPTIGASKLKALLSAARSAKKDSDEINDSIREKIGYAKEHDHLNTEVFSLLRRLDRKEPEKLKVFLEDLEHGLDVSGLQKRADDAISMAFGPGEEADEDGDEADNNVTPLRAAE